MAAETTALARADLVFIVTASYPYHPGEQFFESEIPIWRADYPGRIVLLPITARGVPREVPEGVEVSQILARSYHSYPARIAAVGAALISGFFWREWGWLSRRQKLLPAYILQALKAVAQVFLLKRAFEHAERALGGPDLIYTYWFGFSTYAATLLGPGRRVVSRAHRIDLYESCRSDGHMPLRRQFMGRVDRIFPVSQDGVDYLQREYGGDWKARISLARLGVTLPDIPAPAPQTGMHILSVSFCVPIKNIERIMQAVRLLQDRMPSIAVSWDHIGAGVLLPELKRQAAALFKDSKVDWRFLGQLENKEVLDYLDRRPVDVFVNASSSEGIPVSIMEAMARGIPIVAPAVGGIPEIVSAQTGVLLAPEASGEDIAEAIQHQFVDLKSPALRQRAAERIRADFDRDRNYRDFVRRVTSPDMV